jgi:hypothetical protein
VSTSEDAIQCCVGDVPRQTLLPYRCMPIDAEDGSQAPAMQLPQRMRHSIDQAGVVVLQDLVCFAGHGHYCCGGPQPLSCCAAPHVA